jgi:hydrogenase nickel incorporation protein HypA/HybF
MHELGITRNIVSIVGQAARGRRVVRITLEIGALAGIEPRAIAFCFDVVASGTTAEGAVLDIVPLAGNQLSIKTMEIEEA